MASYGRRSSQRHRRDEPVEASTSRQVASSSRSVAQTNSATASASQAADEEELHPTSYALVSYKKLSVSDLARKAAEEFGETELNKKAAEVVRYALACEYQRTLIRRDDIRAKVEGIPKNGFNPIFNAAQSILHRTFGFHMVEVRKAGADNAELAKQAQEVLRAAATSANGLRPRGQQRGESPETSANGEIGSNIWVLESALFPQMTRKLASADQELSQAFAQATTSHVPSSSADRRRRTADESKSALDWKSADHQSGEMGLLYIVLALILVNGRSITDATLHMYLRRIHLHADTPLPSALRGTGPMLGSLSSATQSTQTQSRAKAMHGTLEGFLNAMVKQSYLEKKASDVGVDFMDAAVNQAQTQGRRRGRQSGGGGRADDETTVYEWRWGSRAEAEVGERNIAEFISHLFLDPSSTQDGAVETAEDDQETQAIDRDRLAKRQKLLLGNIATVAGSKLVN